MPASKIIRFFKSIYGILVVIVTILGLGGYFAFRDEFKRMTTTKEERLESSKWSDGILIPPSVANLDSPIFINYGSVVQVFHREQLEDGIPVRPLGIAFGDNIETPFDLNLKIDLGRLYISAKFKDIESKQLIGIINYKEWKLVNQNTLNYKDSKTGIKVIDNEGNIVFNMSYVNSNTIAIKGYYVGVDKIYVVSDGLRVFPFNDIYKARIEIERMTETIE